MAYKEKKCIAYSTGASGPRLGCQDGRVLLRALFQIADWRLVVFSQGGRGEEDFLDLFYKSTNPILECSALKI